MATIAPGSEVLLKAAERAVLRFPPRAGGALHVAVHADALKAPGNRLTQVVEVVDGAAAWTGAVDERMLEPGERWQAGARSLLARGLLVGDALWSVVRPGSLTTSAVAGPRFTIYHGSRPWVVVGELGPASYLAMPLNGFGGTAKWFTPRIIESHLDFDGNSRDSQLEMAHLWAIPHASAVVAGRVMDAPRAGLATAVRRYFGAS